MQAAARRRRIRYLGLAFSGLIAAVLAVAAVVWINIDLIQRAGRGVAEARDELTWADAVLDAANDQQNALAGIVGTHDPRYAVPFEEGRRRMDHAVERLTAYSLDDPPDQVRAAAAVGRLSRTWTLTVAEPQVAATLAGRRIAAPSPAQTAEMTEAERDVASLRDGESRVLVQRESALAGAYDTTRKVMVIGSVAALAFVLAIIGLAARQLMNDTRRAEDVARSLREALERAQSAERTKTRFLANMSHELRTPLNGVAGMTEALANSMLNPTQRELVDGIRFSSFTLDHLIGDLITVSRDGVAAPMERQALSFRLGAAVQAIALPFGIEARTKGLSFAVEIDPSADVQVTGAASSLGELLACLLSNAIKFTERGAVRIGVRRVGRGRFAVEVSDTGVGFDANLKARMFETFSQQDDSDTRRFGGAGLGLAVARRLAEELGGSLDAHSTPGEGSVFSFELDLTEAGDMAIVEAANPETQAASEPRVLIVDDNAMNRKVLELILEQVGVGWVSVENGRQAVEAASAQPFTAVLMDIQMPVMDGLSATREIRRNECESGRPTVPVIIVSASCQPEHLDAGRAAGAQRHLGKPVSAHTLIEALNDVLVDSAQAA
jgi:signal transduction histidine kinase/ActR/RegA family two-component response regulator